MRWRYQSTVLALCTLAFFVVMYARVAISPLVPDIAGTFGASNAMMGLALSGMWVAYGLTQFPSGVLGDRFGERPIVLLALFGTATAAVLIAIAPGFTAFALAAVILGGLAGFHYSAGTALLARIHDNVGTAIGVHNSGATVAGLLAPITVAGVAVQTGWRPAMLTAAAVAGLAGLAFRFGVRTTPPRRSDVPIGDRFHPAVVRDFLRRPVIAAALLVAVAAEFVWQAVASFLPVFLVIHHGYGTTTAAVAFSAYFLSQGVAQIALGAIADRFGADPTTVGCLGLGTLGLAALILVPGPLGVTVGLVCLGIGMSFEASLLPRVIGALGVDERASGLGLVRSGYIILGATGSVAVGSAADLVGWGPAFGGLAAVLFAGTVGYALVWVAHRED